MILSNDFNIIGNLTIKKYTLDNQLVDEVNIHNDITMAGRDLVARLFNNNAGTEIKRVSMIHVGKAQRAFEPGQRELVSAVGVIPIKKFEILQATTDDDIPRTMLRLTGELEEDDCNGGLREAGLFTADDPPIMYNRVTFDVITKSDQFKLTLIWEIIF